ncbi:MAG: DUF547 domain-containing protein [Hyphomicrobiaceae bacterium]|nr:DUF547 domain-containing protein [Hyphomicrobiaceae bacterium]
MMRIARFALHLAVLLAAIIGSAPPASADLAGGIIGRSDSRSTGIVDHGAWSGLLKTYVKTAPDGINRVDYAAFKAGGHGKLKGYLKQMIRVDPRLLSRNEQFAFLVNLYNAKTIDIVLEHYPVSSIKDISLGGGLLAAFAGGPWKKKVVAINSIAVSLDDIEHEILRKTFRDPRVHYALNCASLGCPNIARQAFSGATLDAQLDAAARSFINHPRGVHVAAGRVVVSSIYEWFKADFGGSSGHVLRHLLKYAKPELAAKLKSKSSISGNDYDWRLNDVRGRAP